MRRQQSPVTVRVPGRNVGEAVARLTTVADRERARRPRRPGDLRIRVRPDGRVRIGRLSGSSLSYPTLRGGLEPAPRGGVQLTGTVREDGAGLLVIGGEVLVGVVGLVLILAGVSSGEPGGVVAGGFSLVLGVVVAWVLHRLRRGFGTEADEFVGVLERALGRRG
ncbi:hypothetical protein [Blastococcus atacamensis]|uniref:hypothetical protein n=1 Tax=Blastococcus atacamensis TaxID=2070508 RepID=UPI0013000B3D|nr:hypothetical protein [Blastococcus atacamensis]